jgi:hypothetical protein
VLSPPVAQDAPAAAEELAEVDVAVSPRAVAPRLRAAVSTTRGPARWCHVLDAKYRPGERATILYDLDGELVVGRLHLGEERRRFTVAPAVDDPYLPGLAPALRPGTMAGVLSELLAERVRRCRVTMVRYRPDKRATLRIDLRTGGGRRTVFAKLYHDPAKAAAVHAETSCLVSAGVASPLALAPPLGHCPELSMVVQESLAGMPLRSDRVETAGRALAALHRSAVMSGRSRPSAPAVAKLRRRAHQVALADPPLGARMVDLADALDAAAPGDDGAVLVHGDCKPSQFLVSGPTVGLLDFDHCAMADPAADVGTFVATLRQRGERVEVGARFVAAYGADAPRDDLARRVRYHSALALLRKSQRAFARAWRSPVAGQLVDGAWQSLRGESPKVNGRTGRR